MVLHPPCEAVGLVLGEGVRIGDGALCGAHVEVADGELLEQWR